MKTFLEKLSSSGVDYNGHEILHKLVYERGYTADELKIITGYKSNHIYHILTNQQTCSKKLLTVLKKIYESKEKIAVTVPEKKYKFNVKEDINKAAKKLFAISYNVTPQMICEEAKVSITSFYKYANIHELRIKFIQKETT